MPTPAHLLARALRQHTGAQRRSVALVGDSTVEVGYLHSSRRPDALLAAALPWLDVVNLGQSGETVERMMELEPERYDAIVTAGPFDVVVLRFGQNDRKDYGYQAFGVKLRALCSALEADMPGVRIILETGQHFDPLDRKTHSASDVECRPFWAETRRVAAERSYQLSDVHAAGAAYAAEHPAVSILENSGHPNILGVEVAAGALAVVLDADESARLMVAL